MSFVVTARTSAREISFQRGSMLAAIEQALTLTSSGMEAVLVRDSRGLVYTPLELSRLLPGPRADGRRVPMPFAA